MTKVSKSAKERARRIKEYGHLYTFRGGSRMSCYYCGEPAGTLDHCPPLSWAADVKRQKYKFYVVRACSDCNGKLGDKWLPTLTERAQKLDEILSKKYDKMHNMWTKEEIDEMSYMFQTMINARQQKLSVLRDRIRSVQMRVVRCLEEES